MEIGSEFWLEDYVRNKGKKIDQKKNEMYFLSGRTAIDYAIEIIEQNKMINTIYFPSYCCDSMLQPFLERNIKIEFYTVSFKDGNIIYDIDCNKECDVFFAMNYFGFSQYNMDYYINKFNEKNTYIIEDSTHSWLSKRKYNKKSDIVIASLRKWFPIISGAILINNLDSLTADSELEILKVNENYVKLKEEAMIEKYKYIHNNNKIKKEDFLEKFYKTNKILKTDYKKYKIDEKSYDILNNIDIEEVIKRRRENTQEIYKFLTNQKEIQYIKEINLENDCPIFIPIFLENEKKNELKKYFIENKVYCPTHWNIPEQIKKTNEKKIYNMELSLICDQRYNIEDIKKYINLIKNKEL